MPITKARLLIVDDESSVRQSLCRVFEAIGYGVRTAEDGISALNSLREEMPEILISDLNMPGMSGFELLTVVRRRFPDLKTIAMSGAFCGDEVPTGVAADAFYQKGSSVACMVKMIENLPWHDRVHVDIPAMPVLAWMEGAGHEPGGESHLTVSCPECLRTFSLKIRGAVFEARETVCVHCKSLIQYTVAGPTEQEAPRPMEQMQAFSSPVI
jgi:CheY-like chemotaxis protein